MGLTPPAQGPALATAWEVPPNAAIYNHYRVYQLWCPAFAARPAVGAVAAVVTGLAVAATAAPFTPATAFAASVATALAAA